MSAVDDEQIAALEARLDYVSKANQAHKDAMWKWRDRAQSLEEALVEYADHSTVRCGWPNKGAGPKCVCGLDDTLKRLDITDADGFVKKP